MRGMPIYTYVCNDCEQRRDVRQSMTAEPLTVCLDPECGGKLRKVITAPGISFKGTGFYRTDHVPAPPRKRKK